MPTNINQNLNDDSKKKKKKANFGTNGMDRYPARRNRTTIGAFVGAEGFQHFSLPLKVTQQSGTILETESIKIFLRMRFKRVDVGNDPNGECLAIDGKVRNAETEIIVKEREREKKRWRTK
jgi:hypothetical protein